MKWFDWFRNVPIEIPIPETAILDVEQAYDEAELENSLRRVWAIYNDVNSKEELERRETEYKRQIEEDLRLAQELREKEENHLFEQVLLDRRSTKTGVRNTTDPWYRSDSMSNADWLNPGREWYQTKIGNDDTFPRCLEWLEPVSIGQVDPDPRYHTQTGKGILCPLPKGHKGKHGEPGVPYKHPRKLEPIVVGESIDAQGNKVNWVHGTGKVLNDDSV